MKPTNRRMICGFSGLILLVHSTFNISRATAQSCVQPPSGLVSWWPGDGDADDIVDGNPGSLEKGAMFAPGKVGKAFSLDGVDDHIRVEHNPDNLNLNQMTIDAWIQKTPTPKASSWSFFVQKIAGRDDRNFLFGLNPTGMGGFNPGALIFTFTVGGPFATQRCMQGTQDLFDGYFHHVAATWDGSEMKVYVDGEDQTETVESRPDVCRDPIPDDVPDTNDEPVILGSHPPFPGHGFRGCGGYALHSRLPHILWLADPPTAHVLYHL